MYASPASNSGRDKLFIYYEKNDIILPYVNLYSWSNLTENFRVVIALGLTSSHPEQSS